MLNRYGLNRNLTIMCVTIFANLFFTFTWNMLLPLYLRTLGANDWEIGISFTALMIGRTLFAFFGGVLADRYGRKRLLVIPAFGSVPLYFVAALTTEWTWVVGMLVGANALAALTGPAFTALIAESSSEDRVARSFSFSEFSVLTGTIVGPVAGAALLNVTNVPGLVILTAFGLAATTALRGWGLTETQHRVTGTIKPTLRASLDGNVRWYIVVGTLLMTAFALSFGPYFSILARDAWHNSEAEINLLFAAGSCASVVGILLGRLTDRWGARRVLVLGALGYGFGAIAWGYAPGWEWGIVPLLIAFGFSEGGFIAMQTMQTELTSPARRTSVFGIITTITGVISGLGPSFGAWLIALGGNPMPFVAAGVLGLFAIAAAFPIKGKPATVNRSPALPVQAE